MRILHILDHSLPIQSGYSYRTVAILREQRKLGWETFPLTTPRQGETHFPSEEVDGIEFFRTNTASVKNKNGILRYIDEMRMTYKRILEVAHEVQPSIIHAHSPALTAVPAFHAGRKLRLPLVYEIRAFWEDAAVDHGTSAEGGLRYRATRTLENYVLRRANHITTICAGLKEDICLRGVPPEKVTIIPNAVNSENFTKCLYDGSDKKGELGLRPGGLILGFIGSFYAYEGLDLLLESIATLKAALPQTQVLLVGGGPQEGLIKEKYSDLIKEGDVILTGRVPQDQVNKYYDAIDVLVYPRHSMRLTELVTPLKPLEAMEKSSLPPT